MASEKFDFYATTAKGMEELLVSELEKIGAEAVQKGRSGVAFRGHLEIGYRACLMSRIANRILLPLKSFSAPDPDRLYGGVRSIHWTDHLTPMNTLSVDFSTSYSQITHSHYGALKVKDAIVDQFRSVRGTRPSIDPLRPDVRVNVYLYQDQATVSIDLSGDSLHKRGYREETVQAPLKENLAAALLMLADWPNQELPAFLDPMCGSGTLPIEAAWMAAQIAPGLGRRYFGFLGWQGHVPALWKRLQQEAEAQIIREPKRQARIVGYDADARSIRVALSYLEKVGLRGKVHIEKRDLLSCEPVADKGIFMVNPPYGERLGEVESLKVLYGSIGDVLKKKFKGWQGFVFTGNSDLAKSIGLKAGKRFVLYNGAIECRLLKFEMY